jgi:hypothetical protein
MSELIPGIELDFGGGRVMTVPPLSLGALQRLQKKLEALSGAATLEPASVATVIEAGHAALVRNYPQLTPEDVAELIDVGNMHEVVASVLDVAGVRRKADAEAKNRNAQPAETPPPTGQA